MENKTLRTIPFMATCSKYIRRLGFMGTTTARMADPLVSRATWMRAWTELDVYGYEHAGAYDAYDVARACAARDWARRYLGALPQLVNFKEFLMKGKVTMGTARFAAHLMVVWSLYRQGEDRALSSHQGETGENITRRVRAREPDVTQGLFGQKVVHYFVDKDYNVYKWTTDRFGEFTPGECYTIRGDVKCHDTVDEVAQTVLRRVVIVK